MFVVTSLLLTIHITTVSQMPCCLWLNICWWRQTSNTPWISRKFATPTPDLQVLVSFYWPDVAEQFSKISPAILIKRYAFSCIVPCLWCSIWTLFWIVLFKSCYLLFSMFWVSMFKHTFMLYVLLFKYQKKTLNINLTDVR